MKTEYKIDDVKCTFDFVCPKKWEDLEINREGVRYCDHCYSDVFLCTKQEEVDEAKKLNRCIAVARVSRIIFMGEAISLTNLPLNMNAGAFQGFVEGWTFRASYNQLSLTLLLTPLAYSLQAMRWNDVPITENWNTVSPTLTWEYATIVA